MFELQDIISHLLLKKVNGINNTSKAAMESNDSLLTLCLAWGGFEEDAVYGFARASNIEKVNKHLSKAPSLLTTSHLISAAVNGYAFSGNKEQIYSLANYRDHQSERAYGVSQSGRQTELTTLLNHNNGLFSDAVRGYASTNQAAYLMPLISGTNQTPIAIVEAAKNGHSALVNSMLTPYLIDHATQGYCQGHHFHHAATLLERGANRTLALEYCVDANKKPNKAFYLMLLAHITDKDCFNEVIECVNRQASVLPTLEIHEQDIQTLTVIKEHMHEHKRSFIDACLDNGLIEPAPLAEDCELLTQLMALTNHALSASHTSTP